MSDRKENGGSQNKKATPDNKRRETKMIDKIEILITVIMLAILESRIEKLENQEFDTIGKG